MFEYKEVASLKLGDKVRCLKCREEITLTHDTFKLNCEMEYIVCPHCEARYDVFSYLYCKMYSPAGLRTCYCPICDKHFEVRSNESSGSCPGCGHHVVLHDEEAE